MSLAGFRGTRLFSPRVLNLARRLSDVQSKLKQTPLHNLHLELGGKMVPFAGWSMPVKYQLGIVTEHVHTRNSASLFDVSHMLQMNVRGRDRVAFLEELVVADLTALPPSHGTLTVLTNASGGIIDDAVITNADDYCYIVLNAGCADKDLAHIRTHLERYHAENKGADVDLEILSDKGLLALQGPKTAEILSQGVSSDLSKLTFMTSAVMTVFGISDCRVTRCGYTGEDGVEISVPENRLVDLARKFLSIDPVQPAGLGARDSLRLEAGLCLYGNDIDETTTPVEAGLSWCIGKRRREVGGFVGSETILKQLQKGSRPRRRRIGLITESGPPPREGVTILSQSGEEIGTVTSGCPSPTKKKNIAMGYVKSGQAKIGTEVQVRVRNKTYPGRITKMPFVEPKYYHPA